MEKVLMFAAQYNNTSETFIDYENAATSIEAVTIIDESAFVGYIEFYFYPKVD
jgi:hypothetical protein